MHPISYHIAMYIDGLLQEVNYEHSSVNCQLCSSSISLSTIDIDGTLGTEFARSNQHSSGMVCINLNAK